MTTQHPTPQGVDDGKENKIIFSFSKSKEVRTNKYLILFARNGEANRIKETICVPDEHTSYTPVVCERNGDVVLKEHNKEYFVGSEYRDGLTVMMIKRTGFTTMRKLGTVWMKV